MTDHEDRENQSSSAPLWKNPTVVVSAITAIVTLGTAAINGFFGLAGNIISNVDKFSKPQISPSGFAPNSLSSSSSPDVASQNKEKFFVIAGSSEYKTELTKVPKTVRIKMGEGFDDRYRDIKICPSITDTKKYYLVIGSNLIQQEAELLKNQAKSNNFRKDTYVEELSVIDFKPSDCEQIK